MPPHSAAFSVEQHHDSAIPAKVIPIPDRQFDRTAALSPRKPICDKLFRLENSPETDPKCAESRGKMTKLPNFRPESPKQCVCGSPVASSRATYCSGACRARASRQRDPNYLARNRRRLRAQYAPRCAVYFIDCRFCGRLKAVQRPNATRCRRPECMRARNAQRMREGGWAKSRPPRTRSANRVG